MDNWCFAIKNRVLNLVLQIIGLIYRVLAKKTGSSSSLDLPLTAVGFRKPLPERQFSAQPVEFLFLGCVRKACILATYVWEKIIADLEKQSFKPVYWLGETRNTSLIRLSTMPGTTST